MSGVYVSGQLGSTQGWSTNGAGFSGEYDDLQGPVTQGNGAAVLTFEQYRSAPFKCYFMRHDQNDELNYIFQLRHRWLRGTNVHLHIHYTGMSTWVAADPTKNVYWGINYNWVATGIEVPDAGVGWTTTNATTPIAKIDQFKDAISELAVISPGAGVKESSILRVQLIRKGTDLLDTYNDPKTGGTVAANLAIWDVDVHFQQDKPGTIQEYPI